MKTYLVGGAVRDELLGLPVRERDWVVVGATPADLTDQGYRPVGKDFPVFLHPQSNEEYALARTERKTSPGYKGFQTEFSPHVTLEQDLLRRDLTINAIAQDIATGELTDPFGGQQDLQARVLRHVSPAFVEDPLRVLRVARFAARFAGLGFKVAPETIDLMREIARSGELSALVAERVWQETRRALEQATPQVYFEVLRDAHALQVIFPEVDALFGVPQPAQWHPEIDTGVHVMMVLQQAAALSTETAVRFAALMHDLGKGTTPKNELPRHIGHEERSVSLVEKLCARLKIPTDCRELAVIVARYHGKAHRAADLRATTLVDLIDDLDGLRRPARFEHFLLACEADMRGRTGFEARSYPQADLLRNAREKMAAVVIDPATFGELKGPQIATRIRSLRVAAVKPLAQPDTE